MGDLRFLNASVASEFDKRLGREWEERDAGLDDLDRTILAVLDDGPDAVLTLLSIVYRVGKVYETSEPPIERPAFERVRTACDRLGMHGLLLQEPFGRRWAVTDAGSILARGEW